MDVFVLIGIGTVSAGDISVFGSSVTVGAAAVLTCPVMGTIVKRMNVAGVIVSRGGDCHLLNRCGGGGGGIFKYLAATGYGTYIIFLIAGSRTGRSLIVNLLKRMSLYGDIFGIGCAADRTGVGLDTENITGGVLCDNACVPCMRLGSVLGCADTVFVAVGVDALVIVVAVLAVEVTLSGTCEVVSRCGEGFGIAVTALCTLIVFRSVNFALSVNGRDSVIMRFVSRVRTARTAYMMGSVVVVRVLESMGNRIKRGIN